MVGVAIVLQLLVMLITLYIPPLRRIFLSEVVKIEWLGIIPYLLLILAYDEIRKFLIRRFPKGISIERVRQRVITDLLSGWVAANTAY